MLVVGGLAATTKCTVTPTPTTVGCPTALSAANGRRNQEGDGTSQLLVDVGDDSTDIILGALVISFHIEVESITFLNLVRTHRVVSTQVDGDACGFAARAPIT
jgi:hypothetical protein